MTLQRLLLSLLAILFLTAMHDATAPQRSEQKLAQALGFRCQTSFGVCPIPPAPVGAPCFCGNVAGVVVP